MDTLYDLIGARPDDDAESLKKAYRNAVKATHPDHHGGDPDAVARFTQVTAAYGVLRDGGQRAAYDRTLEPDPAPPRTRGFAYTATFSVALALTFSGVLMFGRGSGNQDAAPRTAARELTAHETAAVPAATTAEMPIVIVPGPLAVTGNDKPASAASSDRAAAAQTRGGAAAAEPGARTASAPARDAGTPEQPGDRMASAETGKRTAAPAGAAAPTDTGAGTDPRAAAPAPAIAAAEVARHDVEEDGRVVSAPEKRTGVAATGSILPPWFAKRDARPEPRAESRTNPRTRDPAGTDTGGGGLPAGRRPAGSSAVERAVLATGSESICGGSQRCPGNAPPMFGLGF